MTTEQYSEPVEPGEAGDSLDLESQGDELGDVENAGSSDNGLGIKIWELVAYGALVALAAGTRLWDLGSRAVHHDESLHSFYSWELFDGRGFTHNPMMHGPFQFEANAAVFLAFGDSDYTSRLLYAVLGTVLVILPILFRNRLGRLGAVLTGAMLTVSPALLYFSRFARNDILMAVWIFGLVIVMWRYLDEGKNRYLYIASGLLALAFATKETSYLITALLGLFLTLILAVPVIRVIRLRVIVTEDTPPPVAIWRIVSAAWTSAQEDLDLSRLPRPGVFLLILVTITLPQWSALASIFQDTALLSWTNLTLANPDGVNPIGAPSGGGVVIAALVVMALLGLSIYWGFQWNWSVWWRSALIFYLIWTVLYTTAFSNLNGIGSGIWQGLGYWVAQQDVARGSQPWYYYFIITPTYEYLPMLFGAIAGVYYIRKKDFFGLFLVFWAGTTFILFTVATEKMPWLLVSVTLPLIVLSGRFLGHTLERIEWRRLKSDLTWLLIPGVPALLFLSWHIAFFGQGPDPAPNIGILAALLIGALGLVAAGVYLARRTTPRQFASLAVVPIALMALGLTVRTGWIATYQNGDIPVEMLVYTQTSPDIARLMKEIREAGNASGGTENIPITIDQTSGFTWPWAWYLRDYDRVDYPSYSDSPLEQPPSASVLLVHSQNQGDAEPVLSGSFVDGELIRHRWWFPESTYRGLTVGKFLRSFADRDSWRASMDFFLFRKGIRDRLGSENAWVYFSEDFPQDFVPVE